MKRISKELLNMTEFDSVKIDLLLKNPIIGYCSFNFCLIKKYQR